MTSVYLTIKNQKIEEVECVGHAGSGAYGEDVVCAALSSVVQTAALGLLMVEQINISLKRDEKKGYLKMTLPNDLTDKQSEHAQVILKTMECGIRDLYEQYSDFIEMEVKN